MVLLMGFIASACATPGSSSTDPAPGPSISISRDDLERLVQTDRFSSVEARSLLSEEALLVHLAQTRGLETHPRVTLAQRRAAVRALVERLAASAAASPSPPVAPSAPARLDLGTITARGQELSRLLADLAQTRGVLYDAEAIHRATARQVVP